MKVGDQSVQISITLVNAILLLILAKSSENIFLWDKILFSLDIKPEELRLLFLCGATKYQQFRYQAD